jgi:hypothetical protein
MIANSGNFCPIFSFKKSQNVFAHLYSEILGLKKLPQISFSLISEYEGKKEKVDSSKVGVKRILADPPTCPPKARQEALPQSACQQEEAG